MALHAVLALAAVLVAWPRAAFAVALLGVVAHAVVRRPFAVPRELFVAADGSCSAAGGKRFATLRPGTAVGRYWLRIVAGDGAERLDVSLLIDQLDTDDWARVSAVLRRASTQRAPNPAQPRAR